MLTEIEIEARGLTFNALADGPEEGALLILLHDSREWHHQIPAWAGQQCAPIPDPAA